LIVNNRLNATLLPSVRLRFRDKLALWFGSVVLLSTGLAITLSYYQNRDHLIKQFGATLIAIGSGPATTIDPDAFQSLCNASTTIDPEAEDSSRSKELMKSPAYRAILDTLHKAREEAVENGINLHYMYTMAPQSGNSGAWRYIVDDQSPTNADGSVNKDFSPLGASEEIPEGDVINTCRRANKPKADANVTPNKIWGDLLSVAVPIRDRHNNLIGIVGVDAPPESVKSLTNQLRNTALVCLGLGLLVVIAGSTLVAIQVTKPIETLVEGTQAVAKGNLNYAVHIRSRDEMGQLGQAFNEMVAGLRQRDLYKFQFGRYVSRQIADTILANPERDFWQGERKRATIFFSDIRGFTAMSEKPEPEEVVSRLNEYLGVMVDIVFKYDGTLDKFIGDSIMAVFGAPVSTGNDEERAVRAAIAMQEAARRLEEQWSAQGRAGFKIGIGINTGDVIVGNIGSDQRIEYAAIGDHVNLAARLEGLNKDYGTNILITEETYRPVAHLIEVRWVDKVAVRGREAAVNIYEVLGLKATEAGPPTSAAAP
jgi:class 3 adenylate cyclase